MKFAMIILETEKSPDGEYIACIAKENTNGYFLTDWKWGKDLNIARKIADDYNKRLGLTKEEVFEIVLTTMVLCPTQKDAMEIP